jgi:hypothetical protein
VLVSWGSQSGTATFLAEQLSDELQGQGVEAEALDQRSLTLSVLKEVRMSMAGGTDPCGAVLGGDVCWDPHSRSTAIEVGPARQLAESRCCC